MFIPYNFVHIYDTILVHEKTTRILDTITSVTIQNFSSQGIVIWLRKRKATVNLRVLRI